MKEILAIIPARGGSIRFPRKNLATFEGESLLARTIKQAKASKLITRIVVTTDDDDIGKVARGEGIKVINRPNALSQGEFGSMIRTVQHTLEYLRNYEGYVCMAVVLLQPNTPLRTAEDIDATITMLIDGGVDSAMSVSPGKRDHEHEDYWSPIWGEPENGAVFVSRYYVMKEYGKIVNTQSLGLYHMPVERSIEIHTPEDLELLKGAENDNSGELHELAQSGRSQRNDKGRKRGRRKSK